RLTARPAESEAPGMEINGPHTQAKKNVWMVPCSNRYDYKAALFLCTLLIEMEGVKTPAGSAGQARPRRRFGAEEAHRPPRRKRSAWNGNQRASYTKKRQSEALNT
ncbi:hypothetical protein, partial [Pseudobacillus badius]|uniref:hypothetical protein n=1 Tax=Bacillus badius TaxID=1455 RepID=UPI003D3520F4